MLYVCLAPYHDSYVDYILCMLSYFATTNVAFAVAGTTVVAACTAAAVAVIAAAVTTATTTAAATYTITHTTKLIGRKNYCTHLIRQ